MFVFMGSKTSHQKSTGCSRNPGKQWQGATDLSYGHQDCSVANGNVTSPRNPFFWPRRGGYQESCFPALSPCYRLSKKLGKGKRQRVPAEAEGGMVVLMVFRRNPAPRKCPQTGWLSSLLLSAAPGDQRTGRTHCRPPSSAGTG